MESWEAVTEALLAAGPEEERERERRRRGRARGEDLSDEGWRDAAELGEIGWESQAARCATREREMTFGGDGRESQVHGVV
jgi:hypothetical protein